VALKGDGISRSAVTDGFGDFWFDHLGAKLDLVLEIEAEGYKKISKKNPHPERCERRQPVSGKEISGRRCGIQSLADTEWLKNKQHE